MGSYIRACWYAMLGAAVDAEPAGPVRLIAGRCGTTSMSRRPAGRSAPSVPGPVTCAASSDDYREAGAGCETSRTSDSLAGVARRTLTSNVNASRGLVVRALSVDQFNEGGAGVVIGIPVTSQDHRVPLHVPIRSSETGLESSSFAQPEGVRAIGKERLRRALGFVDDADLASLEDSVRILLGL